MDDRQLGEQLAKSLGSITPAATRQVVAILHDLLGTDQSLMPPLKDLVSRPGFQALKKQRMASGYTQALRESLLHSLGETYQPQVVDRLNVFLDGYLGSAHGGEPRTASPPASRSSQADAKPSVNYSGVPETVIIEEEVDQPETSTSGTTTAVGSQPVQSTARPYRKIPLLAAGSAVLLAIATGATFRSNLLCASLGLCSAATIEAAATALEEAQKAADALEKAKDLSSYESALGELERQLGLIESEIGHTKTQRDNRKQLQGQAEKARARQKQEKAHQQMVQQVKQERETISKLAAPVANERRATLLTRLRPIPADSFSHNQAEELRQKLSSPAPTALGGRDPDTGRGPQTAPPSVQEPAARWSPPPAPAPAPRWSPPSQRSSPSADRSGDSGESNAPYRDEPLW